MTRPTVATDEASARGLDAADPLASIRERFIIPGDAIGRPRAYLAGNSLGAQPRDAAAAVAAELERWGSLAVDGWFAGDRPWLDAERALAEMTGRIVGARVAEVTTANTLTVNLHLLMASFYRPGGRRSAILVDAPVFPSDRYAVDSQLRHHGLDPETELIVIGPRSGESVTRIEDIEAAIHEHRNRLALTLLAGVNFATGQVLDIGRLTEAAHRAGAVAGWDLAHAAGNIPLALHDADVDFAAWCTYKYLNSGPGALAQLFVHERHAGDARTPRLSGWWGNDPSTRFRMADRFEPGPGADGWRVSTPPILSLAPIGVSLAIFDAVGMDAIRRKSVALTAYLEALIDALVPDVEIITPRDPERRGAQLSIRVDEPEARLAALAEHGVVGDVREPDIIRLAPAPLYDSWHDAWRAAHALAATAPIPSDRSPRP
jgi:kynureninase